MTCSIDTLNIKNARKKHNFHFISIHINVLKSYFPQKASSIKDVMKTILGKLKKLILILIFQLNFLKIPRTLRENHAKSHKIILKTVQNVNLQVFIATVVRFFAVFNRIFISLTSFMDAALQKCEKKHKIWNFRFGNNKNITTFMYTELLANCIQFFFVGVQF